MSIQTDYNELKKELSKLSNEFGWHMHKLEIMVDRFALCVDLSIFRDDHEVVVALLEEFHGFNLRTSEVLAALGIVRFLFDRPHSSVGSEQLASTQTVAGSSPAGGSFTHKPASSVKGKGMVQLGTTLYKHAPNGNLKFVAKFFSVSHQSEPLPEPFIITPVEIPKPLVLRETKTTAISDETLLTLHDLVAAANDLTKAILDARGKIKVIEQRIKNGTATFDQAKYDKDMSLIESDLNYLEQDLKKNLKAAATAAGIETQEVQQTQPASNPTLGRAVKLDED